MTNHVIFAIDDNNDITLVCNMVAYMLHKLLIEVRATIPFADDDPCDDCSEWAGTLS